MMNTKTFLEELKDLHEQEPPARASNGKHQILAVIEALEEALRTHALYCTPNMPMEFTMTDDQLYDYVKEINMGVSFNDMKDIITHDLFKQTAEERLEGIRLDIKHVKKRRKIEFDLITVDYQ